MAEHDAPFAHVAYQQPDGTTGVMDNCDAEALHDEVGAVKTENIADGAVTNGKIAAGAVTSTELADGAVTQAAIADGAVGKDQLSQELKDDWDSINQALKRAQVSGEPNKTQLIVNGNNGIAIWLTYYKSTKQLMAAVKVDSTFSPEKCIASW